MIRQGDGAQTNYRRSETLPEFACEPDAQLGRFTLTMNDPGVIS